MAQYDSESAQPSGSSRKVWHGREAEVWIGDAMDVDSVTDFDSQSLQDSFDAEASGTERSGIVTEITLTDPEASVEVQNTFGGQVMSESPHDLVEIEFTARFQDISMIEEMMGEGTEVGTTSFTRVSGGTHIGDRPNKSILFHLEKGDDIVNYLMNNAIFQQMGEISLAGDGAAELTGTAVCRIADRYVEDNFS